MERNCFNKFRFMDDPKDQFQIVEYFKCLEGLLIL